MQLNERLQLLREKAGYENAKLFAKAINMPYSTYSTYESGKSEPKATALIKIATALHVSVDELLGYHVDDFDKAAALFHEATGLNIKEIDNGTRVMVEPFVYNRGTINANTFIPIDKNTKNHFNILQDGYAMLPISKQIFLDSIKQCVQEFDKTIRPRLIGPSIINRLIYASTVEHPIISNMINQNVFDSFDSDFVDKILTQKEKNKMLKTVQTRLQEMGMDSERLPKSWHDLQAGMKLAKYIVPTTAIKNNGTKTPPTAPDHDGTDDEQTKEKAATPKSDGKEND